MQHNDLVSIILPTHNRASKVVRSIESVLQQTYTNWELLIVIDGSTDDTMEILSPFLQDERISVFSLTPNVGGAGARNFGIRKARGEFIAFLDDDDIWLRHKLEKQLEIINSSKEIAIVSCNYFSKGIKNKELYGDVYLNDLLFENLLGSFSFCITRSTFVANVEIEPKLKACQDRDLWIKILHKTGLKGYICEDCLVHYNSMGEEKLTRRRKDALNSYLIFLRANWPIMNERQRFYNLAVLTAKKNYIQSEDFFYKLRLSIKAIKYYIRSSYHFNVSNLLKYLGHAFLIYERLFKILKRLD